MAFLDNSGTIIIDAILTEIGRKRMAQGDFKISKFALGDDEVDYREFSASALTTALQGAKITNQPLFEALSQHNAVIDYGLITFDRQDLLYLPVVKTNIKVRGFAKPTGSYYYVSTNSQTSKKLKTIFKDNDYFIEAGSLTQTKLVFQAGLDNNILNDKRNRKTLLIDNGLLDNYFNVYCDARLVTNVLSTDSKSIFRNDLSGNLKHELKLLGTSVPVSLTPPVEYYNTFIVEAAPTEVYQYDNTTNPDDYSALSGPGGSMAGIGLKLKPELIGDSNHSPDTKFSTFGYTDQTLFGGSDKYDYIDSSIYIEGLSSNARLQIPIRIIRYAGT
tara:strand:+ start:14321 stop:15313 length:993 start_codon:yes stop_codon:yes gene_type:complete